MMNILEIDSEPRTETGKAPRLLKILLIFSVDR